MTECNIDGCSREAVTEKYQPVLDEWVPFCEHAIPQAYFSDRRQLR